ncbi:MAG TPA: NADH-quinone oxidoreductase subunit L [Actinomycetota bacterium]|nr:NADH-quinone oxidoreductase subunit L [Actinomycetota bacterium]
MVELAWLIPVIPLSAALLIALFGRRLPGRGAELGILATGVSFLLSLAVAGAVIGDHEFHLERSLTWFRFGSFELELGMNIDGLAAMMFVVVTTVSLLVQIYSTGYMKGEPRFTWYFAALNMFTGSMLTLVIANNLFQLLVGWELVGVCSYLLIGHFWEEKPNQDAAMKAFITTRTGDVGFLFGIFVLTFAAGSANIGHISEMAEHGEIAAGVLTAGALLLFCGAIGKSAQFPLHVWLPDAMAGPTPVSALIHAATMVVAGIYLIARMFPVFIHAGEVALQFVSIIAGITMFIAALLAVIQDDIKRVLAYSTISQLAYMVAGLSLGEHGYTPGLFHLFTHAFFKALLFLGAGSVIHAVHSNNMSDMGGLRRSMPVTFWTFLIGSAALAGIPPLAGFWSKDEIITTAFVEGHYVLWAVAFATAILTAFYMTRAVLLTFFGDYRGHGHPHESPRVMTVPLVILAVLSVSVGFLNATPFGIHLFADWVFFHEPHHAAFNYGFAAIAIVGAALGIGVGYRLYAGWRDRDPVRKLGPLYRFLDRKYLLDDIYLRGIVRPIQYPIARAVNWTNRYILDGIVHLVAWVTRKLGGVTAAVDRNLVDGAVNRVAIGTGWTGGLLRYVQSGNVQRYAVLLFTGVVILTVVFTRV